MSTLKISRVDMSDPSTKALVARTLWESKKRHLDYTAGVPADLLIDPVEGYTHVEWESLTDEQRSWVLDIRVGWVLEALDFDDYDIDQAARVWLATEVPKLGWQARTTEFGAMERAAFLITEAGKATSRRRDILNETPHPARPGDLMAEGNVLARAKQGAQGIGYDMQTFRVAFPREVARFTMLNGNRIAKPGDMLTAVMISDTRMETDYEGKPRFVGKAMYL